MRDDSASWLPDLLECDWNDYQGTIECAYRLFCRDFLSAAARPRFRGKRMGLKRHPEVAGKNATFWHFVTKGDNQEPRPRYSFHTW